MSIKMLICWWNLPTSGVVFGKPTKPIAALCAQWIVEGNRKHWEKSEVNAKMWNTIGISWGHGGIAPPFGLRLLPTVVLCSLPCPQDLCESSRMSPECAPLSQLQQRHWLLAAGVPSPQKVSCIRCLGFFLSDVFAAGSSPSYPVTFCRAAL